MKKHVHLPKPHDALRAVAAFFFATLTLGFLWAAPDGDAGARRLPPRDVPPLADRGPQPRVGQVEGRFDGEYGLWIGVDNDSLDVRWITRDTAAGFLAVFVGAELYAEFQTPVAPGHRVSFPLPGSSRIVLRYGSLADLGGRHETTIDIHTGRQREVPIYTDVDSIFVFGDVHGQYDRVTRLLERTGLIDEFHRWSGGRNHVVFLGDLFDRGSDVTRLLWFLYRLESEASAHGGRVHVLLGNHEIMIMTNDLRYVSLKERLVAGEHALEYNEMYDPRRSLLAKWLATKPAVLKINDILFAHAGVSPAYMSYSVRSLDDSLAAFISEPLFYFWSDSTTAVAPMDSATLARHIDFFFGDNSVFWYRDYLVTDTLQDALASVLHEFEARLHVVGHTAVPHIQQRYDGMLVAVDLEEAGSEMLLLARTGSSYERYRIGLEAGPEKLAPPEPIAPSLREQGAALFRSTAGAGVAGAGWR